MKSGLNLELCVEMIYAPLFYRLLITGEGINEEFLRSVVSCVLKGLGRFKLFDSNITLLGKVFAGKCKTGEMERLKC